jgi:hypothetical protein
MTKFKYQEEFVQDMVKKWTDGYESEVRTTIRNLKNKAQAAGVSWTGVSWAFRGQTDLAL